MKAGRFVAVGSTADIKALDRQGHADLRRQADDDRARVHRLPQSRARQRRCSTRSSSAIPSRSSSSPSPASSRSSARRRSETPPGTWVEGYFFDDTKVKDKRAAQRSRPRPGVEGPSGRGASSRRPHVVLQQQGARDGGHQQEARPIRPAEPSTATPTANSTAALPTGRAACSTTSASGPASPRSRSVQRDRDGLAYISKQFVRYGLTSVHHEGGDLFALQQVRARGELLHRVSYEASGKVLEAMIAGGISTGFGDEWIRLGATVGAHRRRIVLRAHDGAQHAVCRHRAAVQGQHHRNAGRPQRVGRARASRGHPGQLPRQRRRRHRHGADRGRAGAEAVPAARRAPQDHALHADQRRSGAPHQGARRRPRAVHHRTRTTTPTSSTSTAKS